MHRNTWSVSNEEFDLIKYHGTKLTFYPNPHYDYIVHWDEDTTYIPHEVLYTHPQLMLLLPNTKVVRSSVYGRRGRKRVVRLKPPIRWLQQWFFQRDIASVKLGKLYVSLIDFDNTWGDANATDWMITFDAYFGINDFKWKAQAKYCAIDDFGSIGDSMNCLSVVYQEADDLVNPGANDASTNSIPAADFIAPQYTFRWQKKDPSTAWYGTKFKAGIVPWSIGLPLWMSAWALILSDLPMWKQVGTQKQWAVLTMFGQYYHPVSHERVIVWLKPWGTDHRTSTYWFNVDCMRLRSQGAYVVKNPATNFSLNCRYTARFTLGGSIPGADTTLVNPYQQPPKPETSNGTRGLPYSVNPVHPEGIGYIAHTWDLRRGQYTRTGLERITQSPPRTGPAPRSAFGLSELFGTSNEHVAFGGPDDAQQSGESDTDSEVEEIDSTSSEEEEAPEARERYRRLRRRLRKLEQYKSQLRLRLKRARSPPPAESSLPPKIRALRDLLLGKGE